MFVEKYAKKKGVLRAEHRTMKFASPEPGLLEDVKCRSRVVLRMTRRLSIFHENRPTIVDVYLTVSEVNAWRTLVRTVQESPRSTKGHPEQV